MSYVYCCISKKIPYNPVYCKLNGLVYDEEVIIDIIESNNKCPVSNIIINKSDLIDIKKITKKDTICTYEKYDKIDVIKNLKPREENECDISNILNKIYSEYNNKVQLYNSIIDDIELRKKELSQAIFKYNASLRVITKLNKENENLSNEIMLTKEDIELFEDNQFNFDKNKETLSFNKVGMSSKLCDNDIETLSMLGSKSSLIRKSRKGKIEFVKDKQLLNFNNLSKYVLDIKECKKEILNKAVFTCSDLTCKDKVLLGGNSSYISIVDKKFSIEEKKNSTFNYIDSKCIINDNIIQNSSLNKDTDVNININKINTMPINKNIFSIVVDKCNKALFYCFKDSINEFDLLYQTDIHKSYVTNIDFNPNAEYAIVCSIDKSYSIHNIVKSTPIVYNYIGKEIISAKFHPDGLLFGITDSKNISIYSVEEDKPIFTLQNYTEDYKLSDLLDISFSENGYNFISFTDTDIKLWDLRKQSCVESYDKSKLDLESYYINKAVFDYSGSLICICGDNILKTIHPKTGFISENINSYDDINEYIDYKIISKTEAIIVDKYGRFYSEVI